MNLNATHHTVQYYKLLLDFLQSHLNTFVYDFEHQIHIFLNTNSSRTTPTNILMWS